MTTEEYLSQYMECEYQIKNNKELLANIEVEYGLIGGSGYDERVQTSPKSDSLEKQVIKIDEYKQSISKIIGESLDTQRKIKEQIEVMLHVDKKYYNVLFNRFILDKNYTRIAEEMNYSNRQIKRMRIDALNAFEGTFGKAYLKSSP